MRADMSSEAPDQAMDFDFLTPEERDAILTVLARDENLRRKEEERIEQLKREIRELRAEEFSRISFDASKFCGRCLQEFGWLFNRGQVCSKCRLRVCKKCRQLLNNRTWLCIICLRILELESQTGNWFYSDYPTNRKSKSSYQIISAIDLLRSSLSESQPLHPDDTTLLIGRFKDHVTSMTHLPDVRKPEEKEEDDDDDRSDSDSLFNKFLSSSTPNLSFKSSSQDRGSLTNLYVADSVELQEELQSAAARNSSSDEVFYVGDTESAQIFSEHNHGFVNVSNKSVIVVKDDQEIVAADGGDAENVMVNDITSLRERNQGAEGIAEFMTKNPNACHGDDDNDDDDDDDAKGLIVSVTAEQNCPAQENDTTCNDPSSPTSSSDPVRLKVSALLAKYGRKEVACTPYSSIYNSIVSGGNAEVSRPLDSEGQDVDDDDHHHPDDNFVSKPDNPPSFSIIEVPTKSEFFPSEPMRPHSLDRKFRSTDNIIPSWTSTLKDQPTLVKEESPALESIGSEDEEDDPLERFLKNEALLQIQQQRGEESASWMPGGGNYDLDWDAEDEEAPFSIQDFDHISTGFLDDDGEDGTAFSDLRSIINNILRQSSHESVKQDDEEEEEEEEEEDDEEDERGDTLLLPATSPGSCVSRNGIPMLRKKSLSVISEHTEPSACSSFDESSFICDFPEKDETLLQNASPLPSELH